MKATEVTAGLAESNGSLLSGLWRDSLHVTCGLTACTPGSAPGPTLGNEYGKTLPFTFTSRKRCVLVSAYSLWPRRVVLSGRLWRRRGRVQVELATQTLRDASKQARLHAAAFRRAGTHTLHSSASLVCRNSLSLSHGYLFVL